MNYSYEGKKPKLDETVYVAPGAQLIGDIVAGKESSIWFNTVLRGDNATITIGERVNIQDGSICHVDPGMPLTLEDDVSVGHQVILHGCTVRKGALIGMGATILNNAEIGEYALVAAGSLVSEGKKIPPRTLVMGVPAKVVRELTEKDLEMLKSTTRHYAEKGKKYIAEEIF
ncbi:gamma carbonic anhydrase family protein [Ammoniphilus resinae]|uniref:Carbonic anhydrase/acetyltransferase-like protein (Isoleucine patch superfamily) n=1 Tax=Ammoniphilus resinae TaxID=861532 RepID=A0ABS4GUS0_9BACL|nr:gamma carbonic anhydrase family protein [Ammoniphilus resinae]MBP1933867.1 carbonic anhydrase/acetyltransferase-like protein (isoleucine patch superfamily) [Ammoniphilus resinae]